MSGIYCVWYLIVSYSTANHVVYVYFASSLVMNMKLYLTVNLLYQGLRVKIIALIIMLMAEKHLLKKLLHF